METARSAILVALSFCCLSGVAQAKRDVPLAVPLKDATSRGSLRIVEGHVASKGQFPYQAAIYSDWAEFCGGSLISLRWVLTAGHCVYGYSLWTVYMGAHDIIKPFERDRTVFSTREFVLHEEFSFPEYDIALLRLQRDAKLNAYVNLIPLVSSKSPSFEGKAAVISGFGKVQDVPANAISPVLKYTYLMVTNNTLCSEVFTIYPMPDDIMCLQGFGMDGVCQGDSGGPLVALDEYGRTVQIGITSFVFRNSCEMGLPSGFASVAYFLSWIASVTGIPVN